MEGSKITWYILIAIAGVVIGFVVAERVLSKKGIRNRTKRVRVSVENLPDYLENKFLIKCSVLKNKNRVIGNLSENEIEEVLEKLDAIGSEEVVVIEGSDYCYAVRKDDIAVVVKGKFISMRDFSEVWSIIQASIFGEGRT